VKLASLARLQKHRLPLQLDWSSNKMASHLVSFVLIRICIYFCVPYAACSISVMSLNKDCKLQFMLSLVKRKNVYWILPSVL